LEKNANVFLVFKRYLPIAKRDLHGLLINALQETASQSLVYRDRRLKDFSGKSFKFVSHDCLRMEFHHEITKQIIGVLFRDFVLSFFRDSKVFLAAASSQLLDDLLDVALLLSVGHQNRVAVLNDNEIADAERRDQFAFLGDD